MKNKPYWSEVSHWKDILGSPGWLLFDNSTIVDILTYESEELVLEFQKQHIELLTITPVLFELYNIADDKDIQQRQRFVVENGFNILSIDHNIELYAKKVQKYLAIKKYRANIADLYLAGTLLRYSNESDDVMLITSDIKDFPSSLFIRAGAIILTGPTKSKTNFLLKVNMEEKAAVKQLSE